MESSTTDELHFKIYLVVNPNGRVTIVNYPKKHFHLKVDKSDGFLAIVDDPLVISSTLY